MNIYYNFQATCGILVLLVSIFIHGQIKLNKHNYTNILFYKLILLYAVFILIDLYSCTSISNIFSSIVTIFKNLLIIIFSFLWLQFIFSFMAREHSISIRRFLNLSLKESKILLNKNYYCHFLLLSITMIFCSVFKVVYPSNLISLTIISVSLTICYLMLLDYEMTHDALTKVQNRFAFEKCIQNIKRLREPQKSTSSISVINIDLDDFKSINDTFGHKEGDKALKHFAKLLMKIFPANCVFRYGGDEFIIILSANKILSQKLVNKLLSEVCQFNLTKMKPYSINFSYGITTCSLSDANITAILSDCDNLMYVQKKYKKIAK